MATNDKVKNLLEQLGIEKIVWIDDRFSEVEDDAYLRHVNSLVEEVLDHKDGPRKLETVIGGSLDKMPPQVKSRVVDEYIRKNTGKLKTFETQLDSLKAELGLGVKHDLAQDTFVKMIDSLGSNVTKHCLKKWQEITKEEKSAYSKCLFLVDRQFTRESAGENAGDEIIHEIAGLACVDYFCIMFTYTTDPQGEDAARKEILSELFKRLNVTPTRNIPPIRSSFHVLAKSRVTENDDPESSFAEALKHALLRSLHTRLVDLTHGAMEVGMNNTADELTNLSIYDIDRSVFLNSLNEGASEVDVIFRLLGLGQRRKIEDILIENNQELLSTLDKLRKLQISVGDKVAPVLTADSPIKKWRQEEMLVRGDIINKTHTPLACGDIFIKDVQGGGKPTRYILLCQPCDLMVRSDGSSKGKEGFFVEVIEVDGTNEKYKAPFYYSLDFPGGALVCDFRNWGSVSLEVVRLAVFNTQGKISFTHGTQLPSGIHLLGWKKLFSDAKNRFGAAPQGSGKNEIHETYVCLSLNERIKGRAGKGNKSNVSFPYTRERRIRTPYAEAILSSFLNYNARAAFDHDFAATGQASTDSEEKVTLPEDTAAKALMVSQVNGSEEGVPDQKIETEKTI
ncbi:hypothetical protein [Undibacterium pigrum]|uniref:Uncharacterized protein n=1 Tax=Undibacterium pigrum TaxID=401470 RepID=A0A318JAD4_9BURK|nr:hypothetical protein [Undibacterium pigrum]PXX44269.1 hypothetical protein DFR42_103539 [Undibacterium pigrum]